MSKKKITGYTSIAIEKRAKRNFDDLKPEGFSINMLLKYLLFNPEVMFRAFDKFQKDKAQFKHDIFIE